MRTAVAAVRKSAFDGEAKEKVIELYKNAQSLLGKAASKGYLHKNTAQRRIARLTAMVKADPKTLTPINVKGKKKKGTKKK